MSHIKPGIHDLSFTEYHALDAWGSGSLKAMRRGPPARVIWERDSDRRDTDATILGSAVHCALLTPDLFEAQYAIKPEGMSFATKDGKAWRDDPVRAGRALLSHDVGATVAAIAEGLLNKSAVCDSLERSTHREASLLWDCSITGERCKGRPDWIEGRYIYDLKTSRHAGGGALAYRAFVDGWFHQLAHYRTGAMILGLPVVGGRLVVVEPTPPHFVYTLEIKRDALDLIDIENTSTVKMLRDCRVSGVWEGTPDEWAKIDAPASADLVQFNDVVVGEEAEMAEELT